MAKVYKGVGTQIARMAGEHRIMDDAAEKVRAGAARRAATHKDTGEYSNNFKVAKDKAPEGKGVTDRVVYNDHHASLIIEFGHFAEKKDGTTGKWVDGQFNLIGATYGEG